jgi:ornithine lipid ester-linked acyl 2-hydroxylase
MKKLWFSIYDEKRYSDSDPDFFDPNDFDWTKQIVDNFSLINEEFISYINQNDGFNPYFNQTMSSKKGKWSTIGLKFWSLQIYKNQKNFPKTTAILSQIPQLQTASFNRLEAGTDIAAHCGDTNAIYRCHLGLIIPDSLPNCGFKVNETEKEWKQGELLVFCDANLHEAWNHTEKDRYILLFDVIKDEFLPKKNVINATVLSALFIQKILLVFLFVFRVKNISKLENKSRKWLIPVVFVLKPLAFIASRIVNLIRFY